MNHDRFFGGFGLIFAIVFIIGLIGVVYNGYLMGQCMKSGDPNSKACFEYNVANNNLRNNNVNLNLNGN
jgi:hypothetical protein